MKKRRSSGDSDTFGLSFLDCICCGFGAVILLFVVTTRDDGKIVAETTGVFQAEIDKAEKQLDEGKKNLFRLVNTIDEKSKEKVETSGLSARVIKEIEETKREVAEKNKKSQAQVDTLAKLDSEIKKIEEEIKKLQPGQSKDSGKAIRPSKGTERRHYLTGLKVDGDRAMILVDASLSMLDYSALKVGQFYRNATPSQKLTSEKWIRVLDSVDWLLATMEAKQYQIYLYNEKTRPALAGTDGVWLDKKDWKQVQEVANCFWNTPPEGGSNLEEALSKVYAMNPPPDNIFLLTDGLPTLSSEAPKNSVSIVDRNRYMLDVRRLTYGKSTPVNIILYPFQGEPSAPWYYWDLSSRTGGSFFCPAEGWPN